jgi:glucose/arabinose dehydrogenase/mono/diheme cytochrome c family protein
MGPVEKPVNRRANGRLCRTAALLAALLVAVSVPPHASSIALQQPQAVTPPPAQWADWVEPDFPFFSSVVDARAAGLGHADNLSPRALVLNLGNGCWAAFDTDLLRVAAIWNGKGLSANALAPGSYLRPDKKTPGGQTPAPEPAGAVWVVNGIYPGWQLGERPSFSDPREPAPTAAEVGRGPIPERMGRFDAIRLLAKGVSLEYSVGRTSVAESITARAGTGEGQAPAVTRHFRIAASDAPLVVVLGSKAGDTDVTLGSDAVLADGVTLAEYSRDGNEVQAGASANAAAGSYTWVARVPAHRRPIEFSVLVSSRAPKAIEAAANAAPATRERTGRRWDSEITTRITPSTSKSAFVVDDVELPVENPWRRNVRPGDIQFLSDGTGVLVTIDGDVWLVRGLNEPGGVARWRRFTSGLHEPLTIAIRNDEIFAFDRNGIWRLRDTDRDGEANVHELFSNAFAQTADMREFPSTVRAAPNGEFVIAKGGQEATTIGKHNGSVLRISADGRSSTVLGYGFRQPNLSVNPRTGLVLASDQQGNYVPSTPLHVVRDRQFYGFLSDKLPREVYPAPIAEPLTWIPHAANASALSQVWLYGARMGPLNDALVHIGFNSPEIFRVLLDERTGRLQAAVVSVTRDFDFPTLNGSVNPADGQLYLTGFQILGWGTTATRLTGLGRVRYTGAEFTGPREVVAMQSGILLRFDVALDAAAATNPDNFSVTSWHYQRTYNYGSPQFKADGSHGIDRLAPSRAYVSSDRRAVFVAVPQMSPVMQMRVAWSLKSSTGTPFQESAYFTPYRLAPFDPVKEGFGSLTVDLTPRKLAAEQAAPVTAEEGKRLSQLYGCAACHAVTADAPSGLGPSWKGLYGSQRSYAKGVLRAVADDAYLRESILQPTAKVVAGYERGEAGMPSYAGVLTDAQIESILLFIRTLR